MRRVVWLLCATVWVATGCVPHRAGSPQSAPGPLVVSALGLGSDPGEQDHALQLCRKHGFDTRWCAVDLPRDGQLDAQKTVADWQRAASAGVLTLGQFRGFYVDPMQDQHGHAIRGLGFGSFASRKNIEQATRVLTTVAKQLSARPGAALRIGPWSYVMLHDRAAYWHHDLDCFADYSPHARRQFAAWLRDTHYRDRAPKDDSNRDGHTFVRDTGLTVARWLDVKPPLPEKRHDQPYLWYLWMRYREWSAAEFFMRVEAGLAPHHVRLALSDTGLGSYPNVGPFWGDTPYERFRACSLPSVSESLPDHPGTSLGLYQSDQLCTWLDRPPLHWVSLDRHSPYEDLLGRKWDWQTSPHTAPGQPGMRSLFQLRQPIDRRYVARAMAHGFMHRIRGWVLRSSGPMVRRHPELLDEAAYWAGLRRTHAALLWRARPVVPQIAVLWPWSAGIFEPAGGSLHKHEFVWGSKLLIESHYPIAVVTEQEVAEKKVLRNFRCLYLWSVDRLPREVGVEIARFVKRGGHVFGSHNSLAARIPRDDPRLFQFVFGARLDSTLRGGRIRLSPVKSLDVGRNPVPNRGLIATVRLAGASVLGGCRGKIVATFTPRSLWIGSQPGREVFTNCPPQYITCEVKGDSLRERSAVEHDDYRRLVAAVARRARVTPLADVSCRGHNASHIEVGALRDPRTGVCWYTFINHEDLGDPCLVRLHHSGKQPDRVVWDLLGNRRVDTGGEGDRFEWRVPPWGVAMLVAGPRQAVRKLGAEQARFSRKWQARQRPVPSPRFRSGG